MIGLRQKEERAYINVVMEMVPNIRESERTLSGGVRVPSVDEETFLSKFNEAIQLFLGDTVVLPQCIKCETRNSILSFGPNRNFPLGFCIDELFLCRAVFECQSFKQIDSIRAALVLSSPKIDNNTVRFSIKGCSPVLSSLAYPNPRLF